MKRRSSAKVRYKPRSLVPFAGVGVLVGGLVAPLLLYVPSAHAATASMYLTPASSTVTVNSTFTVGVRINASEAINGVRAYLTYNTAHLQFVSIDASGSSFTIEAPSSGGNGAVDINRGQIGGVSGDKQIANVSFKAVATTQTSVQFGSSNAYRQSDSSDALSSTTGGNYNLVASAATPSPTPPAPAPVKVTPGKTTTPPAATTPPPAAGTPPATTPPPVTGTVTPSPTATPSTPDAKTLTTMTPATGLSSNKTAVVGVSGLLVVAAAAAALVFFRRRHVPFGTGTAAHAVVMGSTPQQPSYAPGMMGMVNRQPQPSQPHVAPSQPAASPVYAQRPLPGAVATPGSVASPSAPAPLPAQPAPQVAQPATVGQPAPAPAPAASAPGGTISPTGPQNVPPAPPA